MGKCKKIFLSGLIPPGLWLIMLTVLFQGGSMAGNYPASAIPESLLQDANVVYRVNNMHVVVEGPGSFVLKREIVVTILNENGKGHDILVMPYDMHSSVRLHSGEIYDARGNQVRRIRRRDLEDTSNFQSFSLYEDNRVMYFEPRISTYPYTVKYVYETSFSRGLFHALSFFPHMGYDRGVEKAKLSVEFPEDMEIFYRLANHDTEPQQGQRNTKTLTWQFDNLKPLPREYLSPGFREVAPGVLFSTDRFEYDSYAGNNHSWQEFGQWIWQLNKGRDQLPHDRVAFLQDMVKDMEDDREKTKAIYEFMQARTRYVNIALGIGGFQPFDATTTDRTGYGDCKALTNYTMAMLKAVGIPSHYTLVHAGVGRYRYVQEDFPVSQFNHAILCVPLENDTVWLECTETFAPFGHLGDSSDDRPVLLITEEGGKLTRTPAYHQDENVIASSATLKVDGNGHGTAHVNFAMGGVHFPDYAHLERWDSNRQKQWLLQQVKLPNYNVTDFYIVNEVTDSPRTLISLEAELRSIATVSDTRLMMPLTIFSTGGFNAPRIRNRQTPFELKYPTLYTDTLYVEIPTGYTPESIQADYDFESDFAVFSSRISVEGNAVIYTRRLETFGGLFDAEQYGEFFRFMQSVARADRQGVVFVRE